MSRSLADRRPARFRCGRLLALLFTVIGSSTARAQQAPAIRHQGIECLVADQHAVFEAVVEPSADVRVVRLYFRSALYPEFYFIEMTRQEGRYRAVLPKPKPETKRVIYYIEAVSNDFNTSRTANYEPHVRAKEDDCDDDDIVPAYFAGADPGIVIGLTEAGLPSIPPGFYAAGLAGGGISRTTAALIAAGGGAGVAAVVAGSGGGSSPPAAPPTTTTTTAASSSTTTTTTTAPSSQKPTACFTTEPDPPIIEVGDSVKFDAACSKPAGQSLRRQQSSDIVKYEWDFGDGRGGKEGRFVQRAYFSPGTFPATLTVTDAAGRQDTTSQDVIVKEPPSTTTTTVPTTTIPNEADLGVTKSGPGTIGTSTTFTYTINVTNAGPLTANNVQIVDNLPSTVTLVGATVIPAVAASCVLNFVAPSVTCNAPTMAASSSFQITIDVVSPATAGSITNNVSVSSASPPDPLGGNNSAAWTTSVALQTTETSQAPLSTSMTSRLEAPSRRALLRGQVRINDSRVDTVVPATPFRHLYEGRAGENTVEARIVAGEAEEGRWSFDFRQAPHFVRGSLQVDSGQVVALGAAQVVFRLEGAGAAPIRFRYRLKR